MLLDYLHKHTTYAQTLAQPHRNVEKHIRESIVAAQERGMTNSDQAPSKRTKAEKAAKSDAGGKAGGKGKSAKVTTEKVLKGGDQVGFV